MKLPEQIQTIEKFNEVTTIIKKSSFIAQIYLILSENDVKVYLLKANKKYYNASHHCYAYKLVDGTNRYSDAGEPKGTAGIRILNSIDHFKLRNQLIIVSRIFGGVKLGVGPLGKAYYNSAIEVIESSKIVNQFLYKKALIISSIEKSRHLQRILKDHKSIILNKEYKQKFELVCLLKSSEVDLISKKVNEIGKGLITFTIQDEIVYK